ncbi:hypothetical protein GPECTOR_55g311 [Gonium pectorale]|uniref:RecQ mediated genome instability protein 1 OB-fold domain-containing protein n=1 Tax=Gonium pectorale TaxID=33097 RepID=A0A150G784_GONPE|nr:hypothetical protein GPECTOR_55g311 [Gonium pectorale]|eukprot:KXZ45405.1 hypothetical protein GPECTOR_55g311 [Gonium pectorale]
MIAKRAEKAFQELVDEAEGDVASVVKDIVNQDLKKLGKGALPENVSRTSTAVKGPVVLQVLQVFDVSRPSLRESAGGGGSDRLLCLRLTDGKVTCKAVEYQRVEQLSEELAPGTKVLLSNANVKDGVILLNPKCIKVLGGRVEALAAAWETQRRYGGVERPRAGAAAGEDGETAPPFRHFIPGRDDKAAKLSGRTSASAPKRPTAPTPPAATPAAAATATAAALAAAGGVGKGPADGKEPAAPAAVRAPVAVAPAGPLFGQGAASEAARRKLQEQLEAREEAGGRFGRGRGRGFRRGRRGADDDDGDDGCLTLEEYEAAKAAKAAAAKAGPVAASQLEADEALARQLQAELDLEASYYSRPADSGPGGRGRGGGAGGRGRGNDAQDPDYYRGPERGVGADGEGGRGGGGYGRDRGGRAFGGRGGRDGRGAEDRLGPGAGFGGSGSYGGRGFGGGRGSGGGGGEEFGGRGMGEPNRRDSGYNGGSRGGSDGRRELSDGRPGSAAVPAYVAAGREPGAASTGDAGGAALR